MEHFYFEYPALLLLIPLYIFIIFYFKKKEQAYFIPNIITRLPTLQKQRDFKNMLKHLIFITLVLSLASPIKTEQTVDKEKHTQDIVLSIDTSGSMSLQGLNSDDYNQTRLNVVQNVVKDFVQKRKNDRIALVVFGDTSSIALPLSQNRDAIMSVIESITIGVVGKSTALIESIVSATNLLKNSFSSSKIIILLSDGDDTASKIPLAIALKIAKTYKIKIYTIAIGESNNNLLDIIAQESGAKSFIATNKQNLKEVYESITALEETTHNRQSVEYIRYYYRYPLSCMLLFALLFAVLIRKDEVL